MVIEDALNGILEGKSVLFLGAGYSIGAKNFQENDFKDGKDLKSHFKIILNEDDDLPLEELADMYIEDRGIDEFRKELNNQFLCKSPTHIQEEIASLPWKRIYTTNYDDVFEVAARNRGVNIPSYTLSSSVKHADLSMPGVIHLNGYIRSVTNENVRTELKLTESSYVSESVIESPWCGLFREDVTYSHSVFYIGYTAYDLDIRRVLSQTDVTKAKSFFFCGSPDRATQRRIERYGINTKRRSDDFVTEIDKAKKTWDSSCVASLEYSSLKQFSVPSIASASLPSVDDVFDFFLFGMMDKIPLVGDFAVAVKRDSEKIVSTVMEKNCSVVVIHSSLGNGKSVLVNQISAKAIEEGYSVFFLSNGVKERAILEIDTLLSEEEKCLICIEDYMSHIEELKYLAKRKTPNVKLLLTSRTVIYEFNFDILIDSFENYTAINCDKITDSDITYLIEIFDKYGIWGADAGLSVDDKQSIIATECDRQFQAILLRLMRSPQILKRIEQVVRPLKEKKDYHEAILVLSIFVHAQIIPDLNLIINVCGQIVLESEFQNHPGVRQLIDFSSGNVKFRSSVMAGFLLREVSDNKSVVDAIIKTYLALDSYFSLHGRYEHHLKRLNRFSVIEPIISGKDKIPNIVRFYEDIGKANFSTENPDYWLQYGIACTTFYRYDRAEQYFDTAESYAKTQRRWGKLIQIENHRSRFLLETAANETTKEEAWRKFLEAKRIIEKQMTIDPQSFAVRTYPFRRASLYEGFVEKFIHEFTLDEKKEIQNSVQTVERKIGALDSQWRTRTDIQIADKAMKSIRLLLK
jgi:archaellum biogenesis ATPase FlaH